MRIRFSNILSLTLMGFLVALASYLLFALFFKTDSEKKMLREIRIYKEIYDGLKPKEELLGDAVAGLQRKDNDIYLQVFHAHAPALDPTGSLSVFHESDTIPDTGINRYVRDKADRLLVQAAGVDKAFEDIAMSLAAEKGPLPPMSMPIRGLGYTQVGASLGNRVNPFYRSASHHGGVDLIAPRGTPVYAAADGVVRESQRASGGKGNRIVIEHPGGWTTVYAHLSERFVGQGQHVRRGQKIGSVGMSGQAYAPHLHYEILLNGKEKDPIDFFFADVPPMEYANMLYMTINTLQSLD